MERPRTHATFVVGFDGSDRARDALALGQLLTGAFDGRLVVTVVHRFDRLISHATLGPLPPPPPYDYEDAAREQAQRIAAQARALCSDTDVVDVAVVGASSPAEALYELGEELDAAAIVVGSSARASIGRIAPGSVAESLLSGSPCPVVVAPAGFADREVHNLAAIGVAYDESDEAVHALAAAERLAVLLHASLRIVSVCEDADDREALAARIERIVREAPATVHATADVHVGDPAEGLGEASNDLDLLICGSRRYGPVRRVLLGSVSARLVRDAGCPVLVVPRGTAGPLGEEPSRSAERPDRPPLPHPARAR